MLGRETLNCLERDLLRAVLGFLLRLGNFALNDLARLVLDFALDALEKDSPRIILCQTVSRSWPSGVTQPMPVMTITE